MDADSAGYDDVAVLIVAAGRGRRAGGGVPKQYRILAGRPVLAHVLARFAEALPGATLQTVISAGDRAHYDACAALCPDARLAEPVPGGATRQDSVRAGLEALGKLNIRINIILIHDAARIFSSNELIQRAAAAARISAVAIPVIAVSDSLRRIADGVCAPADRSGLFAVQTPQAFAFAAITSAHAQAAAAGKHDFSDDASLAEWAGHPVSTFPGETGNFKLTYSEDFAMAEALLMARLSDIRTGYGYDVHAFAPGDHVWLGGLKIPHDHGLEGHSDADAALHALTDALLGAIADGDIGQHFPPSDPRWRGAASDIFLKEAVRRVQARGGRIAHLDLTIVCEAPKIGPHRDAMRARIAQICGLDAGRVGVKATTSEKLGFTGRREGIAANAVATVRLPLGDV